MITTSEYVLGPTPVAVDRGYGYALRANPTRAGLLPGYVCLYARDGLADRAVNVFITAADARAFAAQLVAAADSIDPEGTRHPMFDGHSTVDTAAVARAVETVKADRAIDPEGARQ